MIMQVINIGPYGEKCH